MPNELARLPDQAVAVTVSDTTILEGVLGLYVGTAGNVNIHTQAAVAKQQADGTAPTAVLFKNVPAGAVIPVRAGRVLSTSTTATDIVALK